MLVLAVIVCPAMIALYGDICRQVQNKDPKRAVNFCIKSILYGYLKVLRVLFIQARVDLRQYDLKAKGLAFNRKDCIVKILRAHNKCVYFNVCLVEERFC